MLWLMPMSESSSTPVRIEFTISIRPSSGGESRRARMMLLVKRSSWMRPKRRRRPAQPHDQLTRDLTDHFWQVLVSASIIKEQIASTPTLERNASSR